MVEINALFEQHEWAIEALEPGIWRAAFTTERDEDYDLYVMADETALRFAVTPLVTRPDSACEARTHRLLLGLNAQIAYAHFGIDGDGDIMLLADVPLNDLTYAGFAAIVDTLTQATDALAHEIRRVAHEPDYHSPVLPEL
jgi:hypothetical protein